MKQALGLVEIAGLCTAVTAADAMVKAANVELVELEPAKGGGYMTIKVVGDVGAVNAAVMAGRQVGTENQKLVSWKVIPRPSDFVENTFVKHEEKKTAEDGKKESEKAGEPGEDGKEGEAEPLKEAVKAGEPDAGEKKAEDGVQNGSEAGAGRPEEAEPEAAERESAEPKATEDSGAKDAVPEDETAERGDAEEETAEKEAEGSAPGREPEEAGNQEAEDALKENPPKDGEGSSEDGGPKPKRPSRRTARKK